MKLTMLDCLLQTSSIRLQRRSCFLLANIFGRVSGMPEPGLPGSPGGTRDADLQQGLKVGENQVRTGKYDIS